MILISVFKMHLLVAIFGARLRTQDIIICIIVESTFVEVAAQGIWVMVIILLLVVWLFNNMVM